MFGSSLPPVVCRRAFVLLCVLCLSIVISNVLSYHMSLRSEFHIVMSVTMFRMKTMFSSSLPPVVCSRDHVLFTLFVIVCALWCPTHIACTSNMAGVLCNQCFLIAPWFSLTFIVS
jgi:hypothetical protein